MTGEEIKKKDAEYILPTYARFDVCLVRGSGCYGWDADGKRYLDFTSGIGVNSLGWCDTAWQQAVTQQAATLQHTSNLFYTVPAVKLAETLCRRTGMAKVFFANSGAEANEGAIKAARKYSFSKYGEGRATILSLQNSFHGRTMATLSATGQDSFHQYFHPFVPGFKHVPANDAAALAAALTADVCAVMFEPIQGEGGLIPLEPAYLQALEGACRQKDILLIADEVQSGVGRTGSFLACGGSITPDIVTLAKGLGGGLPIGAVLLAENCADALGKGDHGSTFGANPVCCAAALSVMERLDDDFLSAVAENGHMLAEALQKLPEVASVSGRGLMLGIAFKGGLTAQAVQQAAMAKGLLCLLAKDKLRLLPPLSIRKEEIEEGLTLLKEALATFS